MAINAFSKRLSERLRSMRGEATFREFAPKLGLDARSLHRIESGEHNVTLSTLATICEKLNCTAGELLDEGKPLSKPAKKTPPKKKTAPSRKKPS